jgi:hypothetical protein
VIVAHQAWIGQRGRRQESPLRRRVRTARIREPRRRLPKRPPREDRSLDRDRDIREVDNHRPAPPSRAGVDKES